jgi:serine/threonine protein kinase
MTQNLEHENILGTVQFTAPEYFLGEPGAPRSDLFSLAVICYQMLTGKLPYGSSLPRARTQSAQNKLQYRSAMHEEREIPAWIDDTLKNALQINPLKRYQELSEFIFDLKQPSTSFLKKNKAPLIDRNPVAFWQSTCIVLVLVIVYLLSASH